ncbi:MAG: EAL domain-containing protein [Elusimicrobiota bacterium]|nr:EAL domain-containing protein [Elusimicrobiota bacterium]
MKIHLLYFHLPRAARFRGIHGTGVERAARADLTRRFAALSRVLLGQHDVLSGPESPKFGLWAVPFGTKRLEIEADELEQLASIAAAGRELGREAVAEELGSAVALHSPLRVGTFAVDSAGGAPRWMSKLREHLRGRRGPGAESSEEERRLIRGVIDAPLDLRVQEIVALDTRRIAGYEALLRGPERGPLFAPEALLAQAARCGLRPELELAAFDAALKIARRLPSGLRLAVNLSPALLGAPAVRRAAREPDLPGRLILEITEHLPIIAPGRLLGELSLLRERGALVALDDAGCGYLNMALTRALRPDIVKLCITVTRRLGRGPRMLALVRGTVASIRAAGAVALIEGVETAEQARLARACGCALAQGYYFGRPRPAAEAMREEKENVFAAK